MTRLHAAAGTLALATIAAFWLSTLFTELFLGREAVIALKTALPWGFLLLIPALAATGLTGTRLARGRTAGLAGTKRRRMALIAANGLGLLVPSALYLAWRAGNGDLGTGFALVQAVELCAGAANLILMGLNLRDGRRMTAGRRRRDAVRP